MSLTKDDAAYFFVKEANLKEEANAFKRERRIANAGKESPAWFLFTSAMMAAVAAMHFSTENVIGGWLFVGITVAHLGLAYQRWKKQTAEVRN